MFYNLLSSRSFITGFTFFIVIVAGSLIYSWRVQHGIKVEEARTQMFLQQVETNVSTETVRSPDQTDIARSKAAVEKSDASEIIHAVPEGTKDSTGALQENFLLGETPVSEIQAEIIAEEAKAEQARSVEELRVQEFKRWQKDIFAEIKSLLAAEGGALHGATHPEKMQRILLLQKELLNLQQEIEGVPNPDANFFMDLALRVNSSLNENGEMFVSEYLKIADYLAAEGDLETANRMRPVIRRAIDSGSDVIEREHLDATK